MLSSIGARIRLYSIIIAKMAVWTVQQGVGCLSGKQHPLGWSAEQDFNVMVLKALFTSGTYVHWRNFTKIWRWINGEQEQKGMVLEKVPADTFEVPGCRSSWWMSLEPALLKDAPQPKASCVIMYLHGGAFMAGEPRMYCQAFKLWMQELAAQGINARVLSVGYPLAPEHPYPAGVLAGAAAYRWLVQQLEVEGRDDHIILAGDSAGGNLVLALLAYVQDSSLLQMPGHESTASSAAAASPPQPRVPAPLAAILISPAIDFRSSSVFGPTLAAHFAQQATPGSKTAHKKQQQKKASTDLDPRELDFITVDEAAIVAQHYVHAHSQADMCLPLVSPILLPSFAGLVQSEVLLVSGGIEVMGPDIAVAAKMLEAGGARVRVHVEHNEPHVYCVLPIQCCMDRGLPVLIPFIASCVSKAAATKKSS